MTNPYQKPPAGEFQSAYLSGPSFAPYAPSNTINQGPKNNSTHYDPFSEIDQIKEDKPAFQTNSGGMSAFGFLSSPSSTLPPI